MGYSFEEEPNKMQRKYCTARTDNRVTLILGLPPRLILNYFLSNFLSNILNLPKISSQFLHFLPAWLAGWNN